MINTGLYGRKYLDVQIKEKELGKPDFNEAIVKVHACGVCGTDMNFLKQWTGEAMPLGHEIAGEVMETGTGVKNVKPGDQVVVEDCTMCGICVNCKNGRPDLCTHKYDLEGYPGMGQYLKVKYNSLIKYEGIDYIDACLTEPLTVALNAVLDAQIPIHGSVAILGCGPLGLMAAQIAKLRGAGFIAMTDINLAGVPGRARTTMACRMGADLVLDSAREDINSMIRAKFPMGVDRVIVTSPPETIRDALKIIAYGGKITFFGLHFGGKNVVDIDINHLIFNKITLSPFFGEPAINFNVSLDLIRSGKVSIREMITHSFNFSDAKQLLTSIAEGQEAVVKAIMLPN